MMLDTIPWGVGLPSATSTTAFGSMGMGFSEGIPDDEMEGMINDLGFFQDEGDVFDVKNDVPETTRSIEEIDAKSETVPTKNLPIATNDTGAIVTIPKVIISTPQDARSLNFATNVVSNINTSTNIALPQAPQLVSSAASSICSSNDKDSVQSVLEQQRLTILENEKIIEAQRIKLEGKNHSSNSSTVLSPMILPSKKSDGNITRGTKRKADSLSKTSTAADKNAYQKWKLTPAGATKLKVADSGGLQSLRIQYKQQDDGKNLTPEELQIRRERNRKHAKKSRLRKKSLTTDLEQSLEALREENTNLRKLIEEHIARKKAAEAAAQSVDSLLEKHRVRSHERFIECLIANSGKTKSKRKSKDSNSKRKKVEKKKSLPSGRGIIVDDKTLKLLKGLSKTITPVSDKPQKEKKKKERQLHMIV